MEDELMDFGLEKTLPPIIKVVGVGGGGGNAVNHMFKEGFNDVSFALCNTDRQALSGLSIPIKIQLGKKGLGAGNRPMVAREAAADSEDEIRSMLNDGTEMTFITAGMGGGTGTGAAPVVAKVSKEMGILTVGIVTIPFLFEQERKILQALDGVEEMSKYVDALLVINNERLSEIYPDLNFSNAFAKADDTLSNAARSIAELITSNGYMNLDFADVKTTLKDGGIAIMSTGYGEGEKRITKSIDDALHSPLLNNSNVYSARRLLFNLYFSNQGDSQVTMEEMAEVKAFTSKFNRDVEIIWGTAFDDSLGDRVKITVLATGFDLAKDMGLSRTMFEQKGLFGKNGEDSISPQEREEIERKNKERIIEFYGKDGESIAKSFRRPPAYIMSIEEMDNDLLIEELESTPAYKREIKAASRKTQPSAQPSATAQDKEQRPKGGTISFM